MNVVKIILGSVATLVLLVGGFMAGTFISRTQVSSAPAQQFARPTFILQQQFQPTVVPQQHQTTPIPQTVPPQGQWRPGWGMHDWNDRWNWNQTSPDNQGYPQQRGPGMMRDGVYDNWNGMHGAMMNGYGWQANPNWNVTPSVPKSSQTYPTPSASVSFKDSVQPIFAARCVACHGGTNGLSLDTYDNVMKGGVNGAVIIPGEVYNSRLAYYVYSGYMPFRNTPLTSTEIQTILDWIALGALND